MPDTHAVIVGGSHAAAQLGASLRQAKWKGAITIVCDEPVLPYQRPPLSKGYLAGEKQSDELLLRPAAFYETSDIKVRLGTRVTGIDRTQNRVSLSDGSTLSYSHLALTTGARARRLEIPGHDLEGVGYLRDLNDVDLIRKRVGPDRSAVIIGGGYIGLETAASLRKLGMAVTVLEAMPRVLQRVTTVEVSAFYQRIHTEEGVEIITDARIDSIQGVGEVSGVKLADGRVIPADLVTIGVGVLPNTELAEAAGLSVDNGIVVDRFARTSDHQIVAAGDCTNHYNGFYDKTLRLESVQNASDQAKTAANTLCGNLAEYRALPWFWSDQYGVKLQIAGLSQGFDRVVVRGSTLEGRCFAAFYFKGDRLLAVDAINRPKEFMATKRALTQGMNANPDKVGDESIDIMTAFDQTA